MVQNAFLSVDACIKKKSPLSSRLINDVFMDLSLPHQATNKN